MDKRTAALMSVDKVGEGKRTADGRVRQLEMSGTPNNTGAINEAIRTLEAVSQAIFITTSLFRKRNIIIKQLITFMPSIHWCMINWCYFWRGARV